MFLKAVETKKGEEEAKLTAFFGSLIPEGEKYGKDGYFPQRYTVRAIEAKLKELGIDPGLLGIYVWLARPHKTNYWQAWTFGRVGPRKGKNTLLALKFEDTTM
jgi:hypothetical protein